MLMQTILTRIVNLMQMNALPRVIEGKIGRPVGLMNLGLFQVFIVA
jgi:hypothetical protein